MTFSPIRFEKRAREISRFLQSQIAFTDRPTVLCMDRAAFAHDITELHKRSKRFNWVRMPSHLWYRLQQLEGVPKQNMTQFGAWDNRAPEFHAGWLLAEAMAAAVLQRLITDIRLVAVMAANFDYGADEGLRRACVHLPVAFTTLNREIPLFAHQSNFNNEYYRAYVAQPVIDGVAVGGKLAFDELVDWKIIAAELVQITGFPRLDSRIDFLTRARSAAANEIVLFTYRDPEYLGGETCDEAIALFAAASVRHPHIDFVIKCKDADGFQDIQKKITPTHRLVFSGHPSSVHLPRARAVLGYNSLTIMESLVSQAEILVPQWGETRGAKENQVYWREDPIHRKHVTFIDHLEHLDREIDRIATAPGPLPNDMAGRIALLQQFLHFEPSRPASERVEDFVDQCVRRHKVT